ncbi:ABC transporter ATP-binding protein [Mesorhizobium sp. M0924]|uniref:ABC transporter ATP-binding protein n=1 Tax=unclassified Mesorhizobium TaxID=325217 RepID=UPI0033379855
MNTVSASMEIEAANDAPASPKENFLELRGLSKLFGSAHGIAAMDLSLAQGEFFSILGPSGCGKTTTLRLIAGFERPQSGRILLEGRDITDNPPEKRPINTVFQSYALFSHLDVAENVAFGLREDGVPKKERLERVNEALSLVRLQEFAARRPNELSGGQQQRVALARAVVKRPRILLLDEPLGALDLQLRKTMQIELKALQERLGMTFVYVTHDQEEALTMSDRIAVMSGGRVCQLGTPEDIYDRPASRYVAEFIGASNCLPVTVGKTPQGTLEYHAASSMRGPLPNLAGYQQGAQAYLIVRPECCDLEPVEGAGLLGAVKEVLFKGMYRSYHVNLENGTTFTVANPHRPSAPRPWAVGDRVRVTWPASECWLVAD